jgi:hypothetical protein
MGPYLLTHLEEVIQHTLDRRARRLARAEEALEERELQSWLDGEDPAWTHNRIES